MANIPTINTNSWRLPKKAHTAPEASYTNEMYQKKGLPIDPEPKPTTGGSGLPVVSTSEWVLPSTKHKRLEESTIDVEADSDVEEVDETCASSHEKKKKSYIKRTTRMPVRGQAPERPAVQTSDIGRMRQLAGLELNEHLEFATGTPYRKMPVLLEGEFSEVEAEIEKSAKQSVAYMKRHFKDVEKITWKMDRRGSPHLTAYDAIFKVRFKDGRWVDLALAYADQEYADRTLSTGHALGDYRGHDSVIKSASDLKLKLKNMKLLWGWAGDGSALTEASISDEQKTLAGIKKSVSLPYPISDTRRPRSPRAHGILDDGVDDESYIEKVLAESRWFFQDFRPIGEAPGGRAGPWRGSDDEPAPTPIVRKGKVHGVVGKHASPEEKGEVDVGKSEIDYDSEDDENKKPKVVKAEERDSGIGHGLKSLGQHLKALGHRARTGSLAQRAHQRAKERLHKHLQKFAKKHGIQFKKHFHGEN